MNLTEYSGKNPSIENHWSSRLTGSLAI